LAATSIWTSNALPPYFRILRKLGATPRPPHYLGFWRAVVATGLWFGAGWTVMMYLLIWRSQGIPLAVMGLIAPLVGLFFGLCMATYYAKGRKKHGLTPWQDL